MTLQRGDIFTEQLRDIFTGQRQEPSEAPRRALAGVL